MLSHRWRESGTRLKEITVHAMFNGKEVTTNEPVSWDLTGRARVIELGKLCPNPVPFESAWRAEFGPYTPKTTTRVQ